MPSCTRTYGSNASATFVLPTARYFFTYGSSSCRVKSFLIANSSFKHCYTKEDKKKKRKKFQSSRTVKKVNSWHFILIWKPTNLKFHGSHFHWIICILPYIALNHTAAATATTTTNTFNRKTWQDRSRSQRRDIDRMRMSRSQFTGDITPW